MNLDGFCGRAQLVGDLFVQHTRYDVSHHFTFPYRERVITLAQVFELCPLQAGCAKRLLHNTDEEMPAIMDSFAKRHLDREFSTALVQADEFDSSPTDVSLACAQIPPHRI